MIKNIIFDFGEVFINLDVNGYKERTLELLNLEEIPEEIAAFNGLYEQGLVSTDEFIEFYINNFPELNKETIIKTWNSVLKDFPKHRLEFLKALKKSNKYKIFLLSNTNELHIDWIKEHVEFYEEFKTCFDKFYLSHEINLSKPNKEIFEFVLNENDIKAAESIFIDDKKENTDAASKLGIQTWNNNPKSEDVSDLLKMKSDIF